MGPKFCMGSYVTQIWGYNRNFFSRDPPTPPPKKTNKKTRLGRQKPSLGENLQDTGARKFLLVSMGGRAEGLTCDDLIARTPIGTSGNLTAFLAWAQRGWPSVGPLVPSPSLRYVSQPQLYEAVDKSRLHIERFHQISCSKIWNKI